MIPFALKHVWFWLSLSGAVSCWFTLVLLPWRKFGGLWGRLWYCVFVTWLEVAFCLGMIWHMDPHRMPRSFCLFQTFSFSLGSFFLTGWCASFAMATSRAVFRPQSFDSAKAALSWHRRYIPTFIVFPLLATIVYVVAVVKTNAVKPVPSDDMHCDVTNPIWVRLMGYGGLAPAASIPFLYLSVSCVLRLYKLSREATELSGNHERSIITQPSIELHESRPPSKLFRFGSFLPPAKMYRDHIPSDLANDNQLSTHTSYSSGFPRFEVVSPSKDARFDRASITDSPSSTMMPTFASNPSLARYVNENASQSKTAFQSRSQNMEIHATGLPCIPSRDASDISESATDLPGAQVGLALTTDEPDITVSQAPFFHPDNDGLPHPESYEPTPSPHPTHEILSPQQIALRSLTRYDPSSGRSPIATPPAYHITMATPYTAALSTPTSANYYTREDHSFLPPITTITPMSPFTPDHPLSPSYPSPTFHDVKSRAEIQPADGDVDLDDDFDYELGKPTRTHQRDPRERLGVYNPTPPASLVTSCEKRKMRKSRIKLKETPAGARILVGAMKRMVLFQICFFIVQMLASLSIIIDVARNRITPFGTQHVALILAAWGPLGLYVGCQILAKINPYYQI